MRTFLRNIAVIVALGFVAAGATACGGNHHTAAAPQPPASIATTPSHQAPILVSKASPPPAKVPLKQVTKITLPSPKFGFVADFPVMPGAESIDSAGMSDSSNTQAYALDRQSWTYGSSFIQALDGSVCVSVTNCPKGLVRTYTVEVYSRNARTIAALRTVLADLTLPSAMIGGAYGAGSTMPIKLAGQPEYDLANYYVVGKNYIYNISTSAPDADAFVRSFSFIS